MFTNSLGQVIVPGDRIVAIAEGYSHQINVREGVFVGLSPSGKPQYRTKIKKWGYWDANGKNLPWHKRKDAQVTAEHRMVDFVSTSYSRRVFKLA